MRLRLFIIPAIIAPLLLSFPAGDVAADPAAVGEYQVKAAFIYNFAKFVDWPAESFTNDHAPLVVTILGAPPQLAPFEAIRGKTVKNRRLDVRQAARVEDVGVTHVLFVPASEKQQAAHILDFARERSILTISDMKQFTQAGGIITFVTVDEKVRFEINLAAARRSGLKISSQLLKLARTVID